MAKGFTPNFANLDRDIERYAERYCRTGKIMGIPAVFGYDEAVDTVFDAYLQAEAYDPMVHYLLTERSYEWGLNDKFLRLSGVLHGKRHIGRLTRMWRAAIATQKQFFRENTAHRDLPDMDKTIAETKALTLDTMEQFAAILEDLGEADALRRLRQEIEALREERRDPAPGKPDPRAMTDELFWEIIEAAAAGGTTGDEQVAAITDSLARFRPSQIKAFDKLLRQALDAANHYDLWALAYLAQDGCSDDAFEGFRAWLILQGRAAFDLVLTDPAAFVRTVSMGANNAAESLLQAPAIAHEWRSGKALKPAKRLISTVRGEPWEEKDLATRHPALARHAKPDQSA